MSSSARPASSALLDEDLACGLFDTPALPDPAEAGAATRGRRVSFCPLALVFNSPDELLSQAPKEERGRPRLGVKTYSVDPSNLQASSRKVWGRVVSSISASMQPILSPNSIDGHGVASFSRSLDESRDFFPAPATPPGSYCRDDDETFTPSTNRVSIKLPSLSRPRPRRQSTSDAVPRSCLKTSPRPLALPLLPVTKPTPISSSPTSIPIPLTPSPSKPSSSGASPPALAGVTVSPRLQEAYLAHLETVPLTECCEHCRVSTEYGICAKWEEHFDKSARRKRREDAKSAECPTSTTLDERLSSGVLKIESGKEGKTLRDENEAGGRDEDAPLRVGALSHANVDELGCAAPDTLLGGETGTDRARHCPAVARAEEGVTERVAPLSPTPQALPREIYIAPTPSRDPRPPPTPKRKFSFLGSFSGVVEAGLAATQAGQASGRAFP